MRRSAGWALSSLFFCARAALAAPPVEPDGAPSAEVIDARIETSSEDCVPRSAVEDGVRARSPKVRFEDGSAARTARIVVSPARGSAMRVELELTNAEGDTSRRELDVKSCAEAVNASSLIVALWLDPTARVDVETPEPPPEPPSAPEEPEDAHVEPPPPEPVREGESGVSWSLGAAAHLSLGPAPKPLIGPAFTFAVGAGSTESVWAPWVRLLGAYDFQLGTVEADGGSARFALASLGIDACPLAFGGASVHVRPCAHGLGGALRAEGHDTLDAATETVPYWALGASLLGEGELGGGFELTVSVGVDFPLVRDRFQFAPVVFHDVPAQVGTASLGIAYRAN